MANAPDRSPLTMEAFGSNLGRDSPSLVSTRRTLDLRRGLLTSISRYRQANGNTTPVTARKLVSMANRHLAGWDVEVEAENWTGPVVVRSGIEGGIHNRNAAEYPSLADRHRTPVAAADANLDAGMPAHGLHGEGYRGRIFWDELFVSPMLARRQPAITRALLLYRCRRLPAARAAARSVGYQGRCLFNTRTGTWLPDNSRCQRHVGLAVATASGSAAIGPGTDPIAWSAGSNTTSRRPCGSRCLRFPLCVTSAAGTLPLSRPREAHHAGGRVQPGQHGLSRRSRLHAIGGMAGRGVGMMSPGDPSGRTLVETVSGLAGGVLVLVLVVDVFHTVLHPSGQGRLTHWLMRAMWRRLPTRLTLVGPLAVLVVVLVWVLLAVAGWALVYLPHLPEGFVYSAGLEVSERSSMLDSAYLSLVTFATLGLGDIVPSTGWLRIATALEALTGFALLTAAVSWFLQIYPALNRRRALGTRLGLLRRAEVHLRLPSTDSSAMASLLESVATDLAQARVDLSQHAETYYFREREQAVSLPAQAGYALTLARAGRASDRADVRLCADVLAAAVDALTELLAGSFLSPGAEPGAVLAEYAAEHGHRPERASGR